ncbi:MAG: methyltransferase 11 protein, partial [Patescibacteria group bacterium]|nr:methyltransferase 11 protein [Patescibacteria group bacterium]
MIKTVISDSKTLEVFKTRGTLPEKYCFGLDERVIEFPWLISQMPDRPIDILDAGSTLNHEI